MSDTPNDESLRAARRERRRERTREEILDAARKVLLRGGLASTTLEAVATQAGMSNSGPLLLLRLEGGASFRAGPWRHRPAGGGRRGGGGAGGRWRGRARRHSAGHGGQLRRADGTTSGWCSCSGRSGAVGVRWSPEQLARLRPLNDRCLAATAELLREGEGAGRAAAAGVSRLSRGRGAPDDEGHGRGGGRPADLFRRGAGIGVRAGVRGGAGEVRWP